MPAATTPSSNRLAVRQRPALLELARAACGKDILEVLRIHGITEAVYANGLQERTKSKPPTPRLFASGKYTPTYLKWLAQEFEANLKECVDVMVDNGITPEMFRKTVRQARRVQAMRSLPDATNNVTAYWRGWAWGSATGIVGALASLAFPPAAVVLGPLVAIAGAVGSLYWNWTYSPARLAANGAISNNIRKRISLANNNIPEQLRKIGTPKSMKRAYFNEFLVHVLGYGGAAATNLPRAELVWNSTQALGSAALASLAVAAPISLAGPLFSVMQNGIARVLTEDINGRKNGSWSPLLGLKFDAKKGISCDPQTFMNIRTYMDQPKRQRVRRYMKVVWQTHKRWDTRLRHAIQQDQRENKKSTGIVKREAWFGHGALPDLITRVAHAGAQLAEMGNGTTSVTGSVAALIGRTMVVFTKPLTRVSINAHMYSMDRKDRRFTSRHQHAATTAMTAEAQGIQAARDVINQGEQGDTQQQALDAAFSKALNTLLSDEHLAMSATGVRQAFEHAVLAKPEDQKVAAVFPMTQREQALQHALKKASEVKIKPEEEFANEVREQAQKAIEIANWVITVPRDMPRSEAFRRNDKNRPVVANAFLRDALIASRKGKTPQDALQRAMYSAVFDRLQTVLKHCGEAQLSTARVNSILTEVVEKAFEKQPPKQRQALVKAALDSMTELHRLRPMQASDVQRYVNAMTRYMLKDIAHDLKKAPPTHAASHPSAVKTPPVPGAKTRAQPKPRSSSEPSPTSCAAVAA